MKSKFIEPAKTALDFFKLKCHGVSLTRHLLKAVILTGCLMALSAWASPPANYYLVWSDEFAGSSLDTSKWVYWLYPGTYKDATLSQSAFSESGDHGVITTYTSGSTHYTAMLSTQGKFHARYGYFEANIQWADNTGMWSAFWLQSPAMGSYIGDPATGGAEIDTCEHRLQDGSANNINNYVQSNIHWDGYGSSAASVGSGNYTDSTANLGSGFHKYGVLWTSSGYTIYVDDGQQKYTTSSGLSARTEFMILSSIVDDTDTTWAGTIPSGGYGSLSSSSTKLAVDYVRYYAPNNTIFWTGGSSSLWSDSGNWNSSRTPASGNDIVFSMLSAGNFTTTLDQNLTINSLSIWETSPVTINSNTLTINSGIDLNSAYNNLTVNSALVLGGGNHWTIGSGRTVRVNGSISGGHSLNLDGYGTVSLYNTNTYTLGTFVNRGTLLLANGSGLGSTSAGTTVASGAQLQVYSSMTCNQPLNLAGTGTSANGALRVSASANAVWTGAITLGNAAQINLDGGTTLALNGGIVGGHSLTLSGDAGSQGVVNGGLNTGAFAVTKGGAGTWTLTGTNTFSGALNVDTASTSANDGDLIINSSNSIAGATAIQIQNNTGTGASSTLQLDGSLASFALAQPISLNGRNSSVPAIENLAGSNTLSGGITINVGGALYEVQSDAGTLALGGGISSAASGTRTFAFQGSGNIFVSGAISNGSAATFNVTKSGAGNLTLASANTFSGSVTNFGGTLALAANGSISNSANIFVTNGAVFDVSQVSGGFVLNAGQTLTGNGVVTGAVTCASGSTISPGNGVGTLSFSNSLALPGNATCQFDLVNATTEGGGTNDEMLVAGNLNLSGTNIVSVNPLVGVLASGRYTVIRYAGALTGGATNFTVVFTGVPPQAALAVDTSIAGEIDLVVSAFPGNLVWRGDGAANLWNSGSASNWFDGAALNQFFPGDSVTFDNTSANSTVNLSGTLAPGLVTVNGTSNYVFSGTGKISGITGIVMNDTGTLTVLTTNIFTGPVVINAGTISAGNGVSSGTLGTGNIINNGALIYNHLDTQTVAGVMSGTGTFTKLGAGILNLNGNNSFSGGTTFGAGTINLNNANGLGAGTFTLNGSAKRIILTNNIVVTNAITLSPGASSGTTGQGLLTGPAAGFATITGPISITAVQAAGGIFDGGNSSGGLVVSGPLTSSVGIVHRANRVTFSGGGAFNFFQSFGAVVLGATNGFATNAVLELGTSGSAATFDLAGFPQTLNGLQKGSGSGNVGNSSTNSDALLTIFGVSSNTTYAGVIQDSLSGGTRKTFLTIAGGTFALTGTNTFTGDTHAAGGTLVISNSLALENSSLDLAASDTGVVSFATLTAATLGGLKDVGNLALTNKSGAAVALTVGNGNTSTYNYSGTLSGGGSLTKTGAGIWILNGTNNFTGALYVDTAQPSTGNDGVLRLASPGALNNAASIAIRDQNAATSVLQFDGTAGNINLSQPVSLNGRNPPSVALENVAGINTIAGNVAFGSGGTNYYFQSDSGTLVFGGAVGVHSLTSPRLLVFQGNGNIFISGFITNSAATNANIVLKNGSGILTLAGTNLYLGTTTVNNGVLLINGSITTNNVTVAGGVLGGSGLIRGAVTVQSGGTLSPGAVSGTTSTLTISNNLNLSGTTFLALNPAAGTNDLVRGLAAVTFGGTLTVTNLGGLLTAGNSFRLFSAANFTGNFSALNLPPLGTGLAWNTSALTNGVLAVMLGAVAPQFSQVSLAGTNLMMSGSGGAAGYFYSVLAATNLFTPFTNWSLISTGLFDGNGNFIFSNGIDPQSPQQFFEIQIH
jgi:autotransporter-associated beta strand protein